MSVKSMKWNQPRGVVGLSSMKSPYGKASSPATT
jgi:hypothetical protein